MLFHATVVNAYTKSQMSLKTLFDMYLDHMLVKFEPNRMVQSFKNFELFNENLSF